MKRKFLVLPILVLVLVLSFSVTAFAQDTGIRVNGSIVDTDRPTGDIWQYDSENMVLTITGNATLTQRDTTEPIPLQVIVEGENLTLTLNGVNFENSAMMGKAYYDYPLSVVSFQNIGTLNLAVGSSNILRGGEAAVTFYSSGTVAGRGELEMYEMAYGIYGCGNILSINGGTISVFNSEMYEMFFSARNLSVSNNCSISISDSWVYEVICAVRDVNMSGNCSVSISDAGVYDVIYAERDVNIQGGSLSISAPYSVSYLDRGISSGNDINITEANSVTISGADDSIYSGGGPVPTSDISDDTSATNREITNGGSIVISDTKEVSLDGNIISSSNMTITDSVISVEKGLVGAENGNISIIDSKVDVATYGDYMFDMALVAFSNSESTNGNLLITGDSQVTAKIVDNPDRDVRMATFAEQSVDEMTLRNTVIVASGDITFSGPVTVTADATGYQSNDPFNGILAYGKINFNLTPGGLVKGVGVDGMGITCYARRDDLPDLKGDSNSIILSENNEITQPNKGTLVNGEVTSDRYGSTTINVGTYQAIGINGQPAETAAVSYPTLENEDHLSYIHGYQGGAFRPTESLTRAECAAILARLTVGFDPEATYTTTFTDVDADKWYANYIGFLESAKKISGYDNNTFQPNKTITRAEFTTMVVTFFDWEDAEDTITFTDVPKDFWGYDDINLAFVHEFITGFDDNTFRPNTDIQRQHAVILLNNALGRSADRDYVDAYPAPEGLITFPDVTKGTTVAQQRAYYAILEAANSHDYIKDENGAETWSGLKN